MPIMEVTLESSYFGVTSINRWNYIASGTPAAVSLSFGLIHAFGAIYDTDPLVLDYPDGSILKAIATVCTGAMEFVQITAKNVYSVTDFYQTPFIQQFAGTMGGGSLPPTVALGYRTNRTRLDIRRGTKRFVGIGQDVQQNGGQIVAGQQGAVDAIATLMGATLTYDDEGNTLTYEPCIVGKEKYTPDPEVPENVAYRYYQTELEQLDHIMSSIIWQPYPQMRTQVSRQYGRGI